ncbi:MAG: alpha/beta fold hydrolase [Jiangellaceae bacterium]
MTASGEKMIVANGIDICLETFGDPADPAILLIGGAANSMDWWEDEFCARLAAGPRYVIRYDNRDTGRSDSYPQGSPGYTQPDLTDDALGVLDALDVARAHVVGISLGAGIAQRLGVEHADRVASLTLISTSPGGPGGPDNPDLPPMAPELSAMFAAEPDEPDWTDRAAVIEYLVEGERPFAGTLPPDEATTREIASRVVDRTVDIAASMTNHWIIDGGDPIRDRLGKISAPTLVVHGTHDPLFPAGHGEALAREIPGARLLLLEGVGHQYPPRAVWNVLIPALLEHTAGDR